MTTPTDRVLAKFPDAKQSGGGWSARCPAHDDSRASLSISEGDDGTVLLKCHAGCETPSILAKVGLEARDLFPAKADSKSNRNGKPKPTGKPFATAKAAVAELTLGRDNPSKTWTYHDADGKPVGVVVRWNLPDGKKDIRPISLHTDGWRIGGMPKPHPLYGLPELASATRVYVCEGEKAADAIRSIGLTATTSPHGCGSASKADWTPLAGKEVVILPDNDPPGAKYARDVADLLAKLTPSPTIKVVELPDLPERGDAADFVEANAGTDADQLRREVETLADEAAPIESAKSTPSADCRFEPFPVDSLPEPLRGLVTDGAKAIGCDTSYLALPLLCLLASAIGNTRRLELKRGWTAPAILWIAIVGTSGTQKSPPLRLLLRPVDDREDAAFRRFKAELATHEIALETWKHEKPAIRGPKPERPVCERCKVADCTVEALAPLLADNPRGLLLARDELSGWLDSFGRYSNGKSNADASHYLSMYNADSIVVDRKTGEPRTLHVPHAALSICGGIPPAVLDRALGNEHRENGLLARLLMTCPPRDPKVWREDEISPASEREYAELIDRLFTLRSAVGPNGEHRPVVIGMTADAKDAWVEFYNEHAIEQAELVGDLAAAWSKLEELPARLALVVHFARWAAHDRTLASNNEVDAASMHAGIRLTTWFKHETRRVYAMLGETDEARDQRRLAEWIERRGGSATARDVQQGCRWLHGPGEAEAALEELAKSGRGVWQSAPTTPHGGRPTRQFVMSTRHPVYETTKSQAESVGFVDVDNTDKPEPDAPNPTADEWGEV